MDPETLRRAMLPFYTTRTARTGLGLYAVHWIVNQHGGRMNMMSEPGHGTCVAIDLPCFATGGAAPTGH
jgi:signal transduction histidine kinase